MRFWVYVHTCPNGKRYVGITTASKPEYRWKEGRGYKGQLFGRAVLKYGWDNITHEAWELTCESEMYYAEKYLIAYYHTTENEFGYNLSSGGEGGSLGCIRSEETRKRIAENNRRKAKDPEFRKKLSKALKGKPHKPLSLETKKKMSLSHKGKSLGEEHRKHLAESNRRRAKDPEIRRKQSEALKGRPKPKVKIKLPDGTILEMYKSLLTRWYINKGKKFEYVD